MKLLSYLKYISFISVVFYMLSKFVKFTKKLGKDESGVTSVEYAIVAAGVVAVVSVIFGAGGPVEQTLTDVFQTLTTRITQIIG